MLETIKYMIQNVPDVTFHQHYMNYVISVQDRNIAQEVGATFRNLSPDVKTLKDVDKLISKIHKEVIEL